MVVHLFLVTKSPITSVTCVWVHLIACKDSGFFKIKMGHHVHKFVVLVKVQKKVHSARNSHEARVCLTEAGLPAIVYGLMLDITIVTDVGEHVLLLESDQVRARSVDGSQSCCSGPRVHTPMVSRKISINLHFTLEN